MSGATEEPVTLRGKQGWLEPEQFMPASSAKAPGPMDLPNTIIRQARPDDCDAMMEMIRSLAAFQGVADRVSTTAETLRRDGFGSSPKFEALIAERDGDYVGLAMFQPVYLSWEGTSVLQITDMFVSAAARSTGVGFRLALEVARLAQKRGCGGLQLNMVHANPSRSSLDRIGLVHQDDLLHYRLDANGLASFLDDHRSV
jgi:predicted N-acetyltransferase YhbS